MEQLLIQATLLRAKNLARRLQDSKGTSVGAEKRVSRSLLELEDADTYDTDLNNDDIITSVFNGHKPFTSTPLSSFASLGRHSHHKNAVATKLFDIPDLQSNFTGKCFAMLTIKPKA